MSWDIFDWGDWGSPEFNLGSGADFNWDSLANQWQYTMPQLDFSGFDLGSFQDMAPAPTWQSQGWVSDAEQAASAGRPFTNVSAESPGSGLSGLWNNVKAGLQDPRNLARIATSVGGGLIGQFSKPARQARNMNALMEQAAQNQNNFANQQAANYQAYRVPLQQQITSAASFLGTPSDIENFTAKKMADVNAANAGAMERLKRYGQSTGRNVSGEMRRATNDLARQQVDARNRGMQERMDWALGQQMNAARLWEPPNYNPGLYGALGTSSMGNARTLGQDIGRGLGAIIGYDPEEANRNRRSTQTQTPNPYQWWWGP
jgi:hypothetical protein